jgi:hypothetical protein
MCDAMDMHNSQHCVCTHAACNAVHVAVLPAVVAFTVAFTVAYMYMYMHICKTHMQSHTYATL